MYCVIFVAQINKLDSNYHITARALRTLAIDKYNCIDFKSSCEDGQEIAISYWHNLVHIKEWKQDLTHLQAQKIGSTKWYKSYRVQVVKIVREYSSINN